MFLLSLTIIDIKFIVHIICVHTYTYACVLHIESDGNLGNGEFNSNLGDDEVNGNLGNDEPDGMDEDRQVSSPHHMIQSEREDINFKQSTPPLSFDTKVCKSMYTYCVLI